MSGWIRAAMQQNTIRIHMLSMPSLIGLQMDFFHFLSIKLSLDIPIRGNYIFVAKKEDRVCFIFFSRNNFFQVTQAQEQAIIFKNLPLHGDQHDLWQNFYHSVDI